MYENKRAVLEAIVYSDIFSFPLTLAEVMIYATGRQKLSPRLCRQLLSSLYPVVVEHTGYYTLQGRTAIVSRRQRGMTFASLKYAEALHIAFLLARFPTVKYIGLSGSVASGTTTEADDIDFFIVAQKNSLFITRFALLLFLQLLGKRRKRDMKYGKNTVCINMLLDETALSFGRERQDLYTAREFVQMIPLYDYGDTGSILFKKNAWIKRFLPHAPLKKAVFRRSRSSIFYEVSAYLLSQSFFEGWMRRWQKRKMKRHQTRETVTSSFLAFHPRDYRRQTLRKFERRMREIEGLMTQRKRRTVSLINDIDKKKNIFYTA